MGENPVRTGQIIDLANLSPEGALLHKFLQNCSHLGFRELCVLETNLVQLLDGLDERSLILISRDFVLICSLLAASLVRRVVLW